MAGKTRRVSLDTCESLVLDRINLARTSKSPGNPNRHDQSVRRLQEHYECGLAHNHKTSEIRKRNARFVPVPQTKSPRRRKAFRVDSLDDEATQVLRIEEGLNELTRFDEWGGGEKPCERFV